METKEAAEFLSNDLRLRTFPVGVKFLKDTSEFPEKTRRPSVALGKRITICQAVTMARSYGWKIGLAKEDVICVPAMIAFGLAATSEQQAKLSKLFCLVSFSRDEQTAQVETGSMNLLEKGSYPALLLAPLHTGMPDPDTILVYGNPAQVTRMAQAWSYQEGKRVAGNFGGKVECSEYIIAPFKTGSARVAIPGAGDRIFSMTQDDEMVFALPGQSLESFILALKEAGKKIGARYPVTFYQNFQPEFPPVYKTVGDEAGAS